MKDRTNIELARKFLPKTYIKDGYFDTLSEDVKQTVLDYLNEVLPIVYSKENCPDNSWNVLTMKDYNLYVGGGGYEIREVDGEQCYVLYFDCDAYRFEGHVYVSMDLTKLFFTDWDEDLSVAEKINKYLT